MCNWETGFVIDAEINAALATLSYGDLLTAASKSSAHSRMPEVRAALEVHRDIDRQQTMLDLEKLKSMYGNLTGHPRREEVRALIQRAILFNSCIELQRYGWPCPQNGTAITVAPRVNDAAKPALKKPEDQEVEKVVGTEFQRLSMGIDLNSLGAFSLPLDHVQGALAAAGYYRGSIDGLRGPGTQRAISQWRAAVGSDGISEQLEPLELVVLLQQVADQSAPSKALLGLFYAQGVGFGKDVAKGKLMLEEAANSGFADATNWLAQLKGL
jgi:hypothetical protein